MRGGDIIARADLKGVRFRQLPRENDSAAVHKDAVQTLLYIV